jgi:hypothetical protein
VVTTPHTVGADQDHAGVAAENEDMSGRRPSQQVLPPCPERVRRLPRAFGWMDARLLQKEWLSRLGAYFPHISQAIS